MLTTVTGIIGAVATEFPTLTSAITIGTAAIIGLKVAAIAGGYAFTFLQGVWATATTVAGVLGGGLSVIATGIRAIGLAMAANPIGFAIAGIALAAGLVITYWEPIKTFFLDLWDSVDEYFVAAWDGIKTVLGFTPLGILINNWEPISEFFLDIWAGMVGNLGDAWNIISDGLSWSPLETLNTAWTPIGGFFSHLWDRAIDVAIGAWQFTKKLLSWTPLGLVISNWQPIAEFFAGLWSGIVDSASKAFDWIASKIEWAGNAVGKLKSIFGDDDEEEGEKVISTPAAARTIAGIAPSRPPAAVNNNTVTHANQITINTRSDQSTQEIVDEIERRQKERESASLFDAAPSYAYR